MRGGPPQYPEGLKQLGIRFTLPLLKRLDEELAKRRKATGLQLTRSDVIRAMVGERLDELEGRPSVRKTGT